MATPFIGEIRMFGGNFAPVGWAFCDGQLQSIAGNDALFALIGTTYGGDGQVTFALPDLRGRLPLHIGSGGSLSYTLGERAGVESVTVTTSQMPIHTHTLFGSGNQASTTTPSSSVLPGVAALATILAYGTDAPSTPTRADAISAAGGSQPHSNMQPFTCINFIISLFGIFPTQST